MDDRALQAPFKEPATTRSGKRPEKASHRATCESTKILVLLGIPLAPRVYQASENTAARKLARGEGSGDPSRVDRRAPNITVSATNVLGGSTTSLAIEVNGRKVRALVDSGASHNFIHPHLIGQGTPRP
jgi:predicted aspartyl protease